MHEIPLSEITEDRFRTDYSSVPALVESFRTFGQIQPIVLTRENVLIAGGCRLRAAKELGWPTIKAIYRDECDELLLRELELEENIRRASLTWQEECRLTAEIHRLKQLRHGAAVDGVRNDRGGDETWGQRDTAQALGVSQFTVSQNVAVARVIEAMPALADETDKKMALRKADRLLETLERELAVRQAPKDSNFLLGDCLQLLSQLEDHSVDCIIMDPPYGTLMESMNHGRVNYEIHFDDTGMEVFLNSLPELRRVLKPDGHLYCFSGIRSKDNPLPDLLWETIGELYRRGFEPDPIPLIWTKSTEGLTDFDYRYTLGWEPIIFCSKGLRRLSHKRRNVFQVHSVHPNSRANVAEKPIELLTELIEMSTQPGELVIDPFAGSAGTLVAAKAAGRRYWGCELDRNQWSAGTLSLATETIGPVESQILEDHSGQSESI